jgi:LPS-assembly lipoprotein
MRKAGPAVTCLALAMLISGCGNFQPLYGESTQSSSVAAELAAVSIAEPDTRLGQLVRNDLISTMRPAGTGAPDRYSLALDIKSQDDKTIESASAERILRRTIRLNVSFALHEQGSGRLLYQGKTFSQADYDEVGQSFADLQARTNAVERAAHEISLDIRTRLAAHFAAG